MTRSSRVAIVWAAVPRARGAAARLRQRPARDRLQPDRPADRAAEGAADRHEAVPALARDPRSSTRASSAFVALVGFLIFPPLVAPGAVARARAARHVRARPAVPDRQGLLKEHLTLQRSGGARAEPERRRRRHGRGRGRQRRRRHLRHRDDPDPDLLPARRSRQPARRRSCGCSRAATARASPRPASEITVKVSAWLGGQLLLGAHHRHDVGDRPVGARHSVLLRSRADFGHRRADSGRRPDPRGDSGARGRGDGVAEEGPLRADFLLPAAAVRESRSRAEGDVAGRSASAPSR